MTCGGPRRCRAGAARSRRFPGRGGAVCRQHNMPPALRERAAHLVERGNAMPGRGVAFLLTCCSAYVQGTVFASYYLVASGGRFCRITM